MNNTDLIKDCLDFLYFNNVFGEGECLDLLDDLTNIQNDMEYNLECGSIRKFLFEAISDLNKISELYKNTLDYGICYNYIDYSNRKLDITVSSEDFRINREKAIYNLEKVLFFYDLKYSSFIFWQKNKTFKNKAKELVKF